MASAAAEEADSVEPMEANDPVTVSDGLDPLTMLRRMPEAPITCQVCIVGAGPAGLMLACNLGRFGVKVEIIDDRPDKTPVGR